MDVLDMTTLDLKPRPQTTDVVDASSGTVFERAASVVVDGVRCWDLKRSALVFRDEYTESKQYTHFYWARLAEGGEQRGLTGEEACLLVGDGDALPRSRWICLCVVHDGKRPSVLFKGGMSEGVARHGTTPSLCSKRRMKSVGPIGHLAHVMCWPYVLSVEEMESVRRTTHPTRPVAAAGGAQTDMYLHTNKLVESSTVHITPPLDGLTFFRGVPVWNNTVVPIEVPPYTETDVYTHLYWFAKVGRGRERAGLTHASDSCAYLGEDGTLGVFSRRDGLFRPTTHKLLSGEWICLAAVGRGNRKGGGKTRFYVGSRSTKFSYVGHSDRTCSGDASKAVGVKGKGLGAVARVMVWPRALSQDELDIVRVSTSHPSPPPRASVDAAGVSARRSYLLAAAAAGASIYVASLAVS